MLYARDSAHKEMFFKASRGGETEQCTGPDSNVWAGLPKKTV